MATRQYVGARYVPKFADPVEWSNVLSYEALTVVTHLGNSFTSKIPVPAGIDISNTDYWVNTGNYNAQVEQYRKEAESAVILTNELDKKLTKEINDRTTSEEALSNEITGIKDRTFFLFGDSLFDGFDPDSPTRHGWGYWVKHYLETKGYNVILATDIRTTPYGSAFAGNKTYVMHLNASLEAHPEYANMNITDVIVYSGTNDANNDLSATENGIKDFVTAIKNVWKNANIKIGFISAIHSTKTKSVDNLFRDKCGKYGCEYIKHGYGLIAHKDKLSSDGTHLTTNGYEFYSPYLCEGALSGNIHYVFTWADIPFTTAAFISSDHVGCNITITDDTFGFSLNNIGWNTGHLNVDNLGGHNPSTVDGVYENPTLFNTGLNFRANTFTLYDNSTGNILGAIDVYPGGASTPNKNIMFKIYGSTASSTCDIFGEAYRFILLQ